MTHSNAPFLERPAMTRSEVEDLLFLEARLLDEWKLDHWLKLYTPDALYWVPIDEHAPVTSQGAIILDNTLRREERVYHLLHTSFPAQSPRSRLVHVVSNVIVEPRGEDFTASSSQVIYEMRTGDFAQKGIGEITPIVCRVDYLLRRVGDEIRIAEKKVLLINRDTWQGNLTFIL
ncbi:aromatic-ring-hydroxylating dioxygenase subunit beta [Xylophilus sp. GOD-11R]|uniref:aromatic-ring-hydroxylating dioxygenase subunit beta n=1 Tax=Xylophilus sp. GOD-11R TaxID=3089814 RepID=UPI00298C3317|nr:aromatic-ring-hydroxylating dioxygenase subunit beta [Xylophilus sp. GOD-11R]WPB57167.1 aromatic-ring-hydroxylating dioxygenase subunit beta [Xylophilus sp. GOD-11R]